MTGQGKTVKRILVAGGSGFLGSHLCDRLLEEDNHVICMDNFWTGRHKNVQHLLLIKRFVFMDHDITKPFDIEVDQIYNFASPAAPGDYKKDPERTLSVNTKGVENLLTLAEEILLSYPKCKIGRLNSTFGPRMRADDSRVIPAFISKALKGEDLEVWENKLDRFCWVEDMIDEVVSFMNVEEYGVKELGHPFEIFILDLANRIVKITKSKSKIVMKV